MCTSGSTEGLNLERLAHELHCDQQLQRAARLQKELADFMTLMLLLGSDIETHAGLRHRYSCWAQTLKLSIWAQTLMLRCWAQTSTVMLASDIDIPAGLRH